MFVIGFAIVLFLCAGLVIDGGLAINKRMRIADDAEQAARIGADSIDVNEFRRTETLVIDQQLARQRISGYMADLGYGAGQFTADIGDRPGGAPGPRHQQDLHLRTCSGSASRSVPPRRPCRTPDNPHPASRPRRRRRTQESHEQPDHSRPAGLHNGAAVHRPCPLPAASASGPRRPRAAAGCSQGWDCSPWWWGSRPRLWLLAGSDPFPTSLPDKETLTGQLTFETLLNLLLFVVWLAWLFFVVCVVVEIAAARRGGLAQPVPLGGPLQKLARALVGAVLLAEVISGGAASAAAPADNAGAGSASASAVAGQQQAADDAADAEQLQAEERRAAHEIREQEHLVGHKVYTVAAPKDGYHDNLWDISERHLGDGRRYKEIYELNKGLNQPDGRKLQLARLIQPGWNLVMPEDAVGVQRMREAPQAVTPPAAPTQSRRPDRRRCRGRPGDRPGCPRVAGWPARHRPARRDRAGGAGLRAPSPHRRQVPRRGRRGRAAWCGHPVAR